MGVLVFGLVFLAFLGMFGGLHVFLYARLFEGIGLPAGAEHGLAVAVAVLGVWGISAMLAERFGRPPLSRLFTWPGYLWLGFAWFALALTVLTEPVLWFTDHMGWAGLEQASAVRTLAVLGLTLLLTLLARANAGGVPSVVSVELPLRDLPEPLVGYRIVFISDLHVGPLVGHRWLTRICDAVQALQPDLVAVGGDLIDGRAAGIAPEVAPLGRLQAPDGVVFVSGNHEMMSGLPGWLEALRELGVTLLTNSHIRVERQGEALFVAGTHDHNGAFAGFPEDLDAALQGIPTGAPSVLLAHDPATFKQARGRVGVQLSGHTHDGQLWPFTSLVRAVLPYAAGRYDEQGSVLYVSRGTGTWGPPYRLGAPAEITEVVLVRRG